MAQVQPRFMQIAAVHSPLVTVRTAVLQQVLGNAASAPSAINSWLGTALEDGMLGTFSKTRVPEPNAEQANRRQPHETAQPLNQYLPSGRPNDSATTDTVTTPPPHLELPH